MPVDAVLHHLDGAELLAERRPEEASAALEATIGSITLVARGGDVLARIRLKSETATRVGGRLLDASGCGARI